MNGGHARRSTRTYLWLRLKRPRATATRGASEATGLRRCTRRDSGARQAVGCGGALEGRGAMCRGPARARGGQRVAVAREVLRRRAAAHGHGGPWREPDFLPPARAVEHDHVDSIDASRVPGTTSWPTRKTRGWLAVDDENCAGILAGGKRLRATGYWRRPRPARLRPCRTCGPRRPHPDRAGAVAAGVAAPSVGAGVKMRTDQYAPMATTPAKKSRWTMAAANFFSIACPGRGADDRASPSRLTLILLH